MSRSAARFIAREIERYERELVSITDTLDALRELRDANRYALDNATRVRRRGGQRRPIRHGTNGGYAAHRRRGEVACDECSTAHAAYTHRRHGPARGVTDPALSEPVGCPHCGAEMRRGGYWAHRHSKHPGSTAQPVDRDPLDGVTMPDRPCPPAHRPTVPGASFACTDCPQRYEQVAQLIAHAIGVHRRQPRREERMPRKLEAVA